MEKHLEAHLVQPGRPLHTADHMDIQLLLHAFRGDGVTALKNGALSDILIVRKLLFELNSCMFTGTYWGRMTRVWGSADQLEDSRLRPLPRIV